MEYNFDKRVLDEIFLYYKEIDSVYDFTEYEYDYDVDATIFFYSHEIISNNDIKKNILEKIKINKSLGLKSFLSTSTITEHEHYAHPFTNIHLSWYGLEQRSKLNWNFKDNVIAFPIDRYPYTKKLSFNKTNKSILSVRNESFYRNYLFDKIKKDKKGIFRYNRYINNPESENSEYLNFAESQPTWYELLDEYDSSIFSFVVESENTSNSDIHISEKTILAFITGTIPIILGDKNLVKQLKKLGFYVWNDEFGFDMGDIFGDRRKRIDYFIRCYHNVAKLNFEQSKKYWIDNYTKIQKNYDIISNLINKDWKNNKYII